jgi:hypothetical protein
MNTTLVRPILLCSVAAIALVACRDRSRDTRESRVHPEVIPQDTPVPGAQESTGITTTTGAAIVSIDSTVDRLVAARCARELTCSRIGPDKHFPTTDSCVIEVRKRTRSDLQTPACDKGIDGSSLDKCLDAIRNESCENPIDTIGRMINCRTSDLCSPPR